MSNRRVTYRVQRVCVVTTLESSRAILDFYLIPLTSCSRHGARTVQAACCDRHRDLCCVRCTFVSHSPNHVAWVSCLGFVLLCQCYWFALGSTTCCIFIPHCAFPLYTSYTQTSESSRRFRSFFSHIGLECMRLTENIRISTLTCCTMVSFIPFRCL